MNDYVTTGEKEVKLAFLHQPCFTLYESTPQIQTQGFTKADFDMR